MLLVKPNKSKFAARTLAYPLCKCSGNAYFPCSFKSIISIQQILGCFFCFFGLGGEDEKKENYMLVTQILLSFNPNAMVKKPNKRPRYNEKQQQQNIRID